MKKILLLFVTVFYLQIISYAQTNEVIVKAMHDPKAKENSAKADYLLSKQKMKQELTEKKSSKALKKKQKKSAKKKNN